MQPWQFRFPQCHQSRCSLLRQSVIYDSAIGHYCKETNQPVPQSYGEITRCIFDSLALRYKQVFDYLQQMAPVPPQKKKLHVSVEAHENNLLNQLRLQRSGRTCYSRSR